MRFRLVFATGAAGLLGGASLPAADLVIPVVLDVRSGTAHYRTELTLTNRGTAPVELGLAYRGSLGAAAGMVTENLAAGTQRTIPDVVGFPVSRGILFPSLADGANDAGTLRITAPDAARPSLSAVARTTSPTSAPHPAGAAGLADLAVSSSAPSSAGPSSTASERPDPSARTSPTSTQAPRPSP